MATGFDLLAGGTLDVRWISPEGLTVAAPPALDVSTAYVPFTGRGLVAFDIDSGRPRWVADAETTWAPAAGGGLVFVAMTGGVRALDDATGRVAWQRTLPGAGGRAALLGHRLARGLTGGRRSGRVPRR